MLVAALPNKCKLLSGGFNRATPSAGMRRVKKKTETLPIHALALLEGNPILGDVGVPCKNHFLHCYG